MPRIVRITALTLSLSACGGTPGTDQVVAQRYEFESRFQPEASSVVYTGQVKRQLLIEELKAFIGRLDRAHYQGEPPAAVIDGLNFFVLFSERGSPDQPIGVAADLRRAQDEWGELGALLQLANKMPDRDADFSDALTGYADGALLPSAVLDDMFEAVAALVTTTATAGAFLDPYGNPIDVATVSSDGIDYTQLIHKYLLGAVPYSQAADDYLDEGLANDNTSAVSKDGDTLPYTALEHAWDEAFGYFGAPRNFGEMGEEMLASRTDFDADGDGRIDFFSEFLFATAGYAAKRDVGSNGETRFARDIWRGFVLGRDIISQGDGDLTASDREALEKHRAQVLQAWEGVYIANVIHYLNAVLADQAQSPSQYNFLDHAKHWSEMKGFALALQFNRNYSQLNAEDHRRLHAHLGTRPALPGRDDLEAYRAELEAARTLLADRLGHSEDSVRSW